MASIKTYTKDKHKEYFFLLNEEIQYIKYKTT